MPSPITIRAGKGALERIRSHGLDAADVSLIPGAAGGPKALGLAGLDRAIFGAWRFAAACCANSEPVFAAFARGYSEQRYSLRPSAKEVSDSARALLRDLFHGREDEILASPGYRLHILAVRGRGPLAREARFSTPLGFGMAAMANMVGRRHLARFIERTDRKSVV